MFTGLRDQSLEFEAVWAPLLGAAIIKILELVGTLGSRFWKHPNLRHAPKQKSYREFP